MQTQDIHPIPQETCDISAKNAVTWERFQNAMSTLVGQVNGAVKMAQSTVAAAIIELEGKTTKEWGFDADNMRLIKLPQKE